MPIVRRTSEGLQKLRFSPWPGVEGQPSLDGSVDEKERSVASNAPPACYVLIKSLLRSKDESPSAR